MTPVPPFVKEAIVLSNVGVIGLTNDNRIVAYTNSDEDAGSYPVIIMASLGGIYDITSIKTTIIIRPRPASSNIARLNNFISSFQFASTVQS